MKTLIVVARLLLGLALAFSGLNGFFQFFSPPPPQGDAGVFLTGLMAAGYLMPLLSGVMLLTGVAFLVGRFVPLALAVITPVLVNIIGFHVALDLPGIVPGAVLTLLAVFLAWTYREAFKPMLAAKPAHTGDAAAAKPEAAVVLPSRPLGAGGPLPVAK